MVSQFWILCLWTLTVTSTSGWSDEMMIDWVTREWGRTRTEIYNSFVVRPSSFNSMPSRWWFPPYLQSSISRCTLIYILLLCAVQCCVCCLPEDWSLNDNANELNTNRPGISMSRRNGRIEVSVEYDSLVALLHCWWDHMLTTTTTMMMMRRKIIKSSFTIAASFNSPSRLNRLTMDIFYFFYSILPRLFLFYCCLARYVCMLL